MMGRCRVGVVKEDWENPDKEPEHYLLAIQAFTRGVQFWMLKYVLEDSLGYPKRSVAETHIKFVWSV